MFQNNCFGLSLNIWVVLMVLTECGHRVTSDQNYGVFKPSDLENPRQIHNRKLAPVKSRQTFKHNTAHANPVHGEREERNSSERIRDQGQVIGLIGNAEADPTTKTWTETRTYTPRLFGRQREKTAGTTFVRKRRQMVEYYIDSPNGVIETRPSREGQYRVALGEKSSQQDVAEQRDVRGASNKAETGTKLDEYRPRVVNDDSGDAENVFFSEAKQGQDREALDLFKARSKRGADIGTKLADHDNDVIRSIIDLKGPQEAKWIRVEYKDSGSTKRKADRDDRPYRRKNLSDTRNRSEKNATTAALRRIVNSILANDTVARFIQKASTRSARRRRQILDYFVDNLVGKIDKRDTKTLQSSTEDRSAKRRGAAQRASAQEQSELSRSAYENDKMKQRELDRRGAGEENGRSVENDSDDLEDVVQKRGEHRNENDNDKQRRGVDNPNSKIRRHNYAISDAAEADDAKGELYKRRAAYEEPEPSYDDVQAEDFYYVEDQSNVGKRESAQTNEENDYEFDDVVEKSKRAAGISDEERKQLSKELVEIIINEINDRLEGKSGHPELQVRRPQTSVVTNQQENDKKENRELEERLGLVSAEDERKLYVNKTRNKRRVSHSHPTDEETRRSTGLEDYFEELVNGESKLSNEKTGFLLGKRSPDAEDRLEHRKRSTLDEETEEIAEDKRSPDRLEHRKRSTLEEKTDIQRSTLDEKTDRKRSIADEEAEEKAEDLDVTKQIVAIIIDHAVKHLRRLSSGVLDVQLQKPGAQQQQGERAEKSSSLDNGEPQEPPEQPVNVKDQPGGRWTTPPAYWVVEPIPKNMAKTLKNSSDEYYADGFRYLRVTHPPYVGSAKTAHLESQARRRRRRRRRRSLIEDVKPGEADFSSAASRTRVGQRVFDGVESAIFCRIISRLVDVGKISRESYETLLSSNVCFKVPAPYRIRIRRSPSGSPTPAPCQTTDGGADCSELVLPVSDPLTGGIADKRCGGLAYMRHYPSVYNFYRGQVKSKIPLGVIHGYGGYIWGGIGTGIIPPTEPSKTNSVWGVLFSFRLPFRLWGLRLVESPPTMDVVRSVVVYLQRLDDTKNRWTPVTEAGSRQPQIIPVTSPLIRFSEIHVVTGILIFPQEWQGKPILPHPVFISCTESDEDNDPFQPPIFRVSSWTTTLEAIARDSKTYAMFDAALPNIV